MTPVTCRYCGLPFKVRRAEAGKNYFCCTGCALLARVPSAVNAGTTDAGIPRTAAWATAFLYFNQLLFWLLAKLLMHGGNSQETALRFAWLAAGAGVVVWLLSAILGWWGKTARVGDWAVTTSVLALHVLGFRASPPSAACMAAGNGFLLLWNVRGVFRARRVGR